MCVDDEKYPVFCDKLQNIGCCEFFWIHNFGKTQVPHYNLGYVKNCYPFEKELEKYQANPSKQGQKIKSDTERRRGKPVPESHSSRKARVNALPHPSEVEPDTADGPLPLPVGEKEPLF